MSYQEYEANQRAFQQRVSNLINSRPAGRGQVVPLATGDDDTDDGQQSSPSIRNAPRSNSTRSGSYATVASHSNSSRSGSRGTGRVGHRGPRDSGAEDSDGTRSFGGPGGLGGLRRSASIGSLNSVATYRTIGGSRQRRDYITLDDDERILPTNLMGFHSVFVGHIRPDMDQHRFQQLFRKFGQCDVKLFNVSPSGRMRCGIVNYKNPDSPSRAIQIMNRYEDDDICAEGWTLVVRFAPGRNQRQRIRTDLYVNECFYHRTTGCDQSIRRCEKEHHAICLGIDFQPFMNECFY